MFNLIVFIGMPPAFSLSYHRSAAFASTFTAWWHRMEHSWIGEEVMKQVTLLLEPAVALFYTRVAEAVGITLEQVLADALFKLAGELSLEALQRSE